MTERDLLDALHRKFGAPTMLGRERTGQPRYVVAEHVREQPTFAARICDAMAVDTWRSAAHQGTRWDYRTKERVPDGKTYPSAAGAIHGFEVKVTRSDWLTELRNPAKADTFRLHVHHWWLLTVPGVVRDDLPPGWGLLEVRGARMFTVTPAPLREPDPMPPLMLAALARAIATTAARRVSSPQSAAALGDLEGGTEARTV